MFFPLLQLHVHVFILLFYLLCYRTLLVSYLASTVKDQTYFHEINFPKTPMHLYVYKKLCIVWPQDLITIILLLL